MGLPGSDREEAVADVQGPTFVDLLADGISVGAILKGIPTYARTFLAVLKQRRLFLRFRRLEPTTIWKDGLVFLIYGIFLSYLLVVPAIMTSESKTGKWSFLFQVLVLYAYSAVLIHLACIAGKGKGAISQTLGCYFYLAGFWLPIHIVSVYPILVALGPEIMFGQRRDELEKMMAGVTARTLVFFTTMQLVALVIATVLLVFFYHWLSYVHKVSAKRVFWYSVLIAGPGIVGYRLFGVPIVNRVADIVDQALGHL